MPVCGCIILSESIDKVFLGDDAMDQKKMNTYAEAKVDGSFAKMLDRGIDDMEAGRELPLKDAFRKVEELRRVRRNARV